MTTQKSLPLQLNGQAVSRETMERLDQFASLFRKWAKTINLVAPSTFGQLWDRHIADSAQVYQLAPGSARWLDLGSGGGFPGIVTGIFLAELGDGWVHLVESNNKKAAFLRTAILECGARASVHPIRIADAPKEIPSCDRVSARALADLDALLGYIYPWAKRQEVTCFLHKGRDYLPEVELARRHWLFDMVKHPSHVEGGSVILEISGLVPQQAGES
jgi:16S rRNA (guanine527-N7)-methyltransferase